MHGLDWQKASFSEDHANCLEVAASPSATVHLRESDEPHTRLTMAPRHLAALLTHIRRTPQSRAGRARHPLLDSQEEPSSREEGYQAEENQSGDSNDEERLTVRRSIMKAHGYQ